jgi:hypothetical protein
MSYKKNIFSKLELAKIQPVTITEPAIICHINKTYSPNLSQQEIYDITRGNWIVGERRNKAKYGFGVFKGIVIQVYRINRWEFSGIVEDSGRRRWFFEGEVAPEMQHYINGSVAHYFKRGHSSGAKYLNC